MSFKSRKGLEAANGAFKVNQQGDAEARSINQIVNVKAFGAAGDGVTDDSTAVALASQHCVTNGGVLFFPRGSYHMPTFEVPDTVLQIHEDGRIIQPSNASLKLGHQRPSGNPKAGYAYFDLVDKAVFVYDGTDWVKFLKQKSDGKVAGDLTVEGDLIVEGNTVILSSLELEVADSKITLNKGYVGAPVLDAGIVVERGDEPSAKLLYDESEDKWKIDNGDGNLVGVASEEEVGSLHDRVDSDYEAHLDMLKDRFIHSSNFSGIQEAINYCILNGRTLDISDYTEVLTEPIIIEKSVRILGNPLTSVIDASNLTEGVAITVKGNVNLLVFDGLKIIGNPGITAFKLEGSVTSSITDCSFKNMRVQNFGVGLQATYGWCNLFENIRFQACTQPLQVGSQFNNNSFNRVSLVSFSVASRFSNCEGNLFNSLNLANTTGNGLALFQSSVTLINPYYEYIEGYAVTMGNSSSVIKSVFTSVGGKTTDSFVKIKLYEDDSTLLLQSLAGGEFVVDSAGDQTQAKSLVNLTLDNHKHVKHSALKEWYANEALPFTPAYGGVVNTVTIHADKTASVLSEGASAAGIQLLNNLVVGQYYTLVYRMKVDTTTNVTLRSGTLPSVKLQVSDKFVTRCVPFVGDQNLLRMIWDGGKSVDIDYVGIYEGVVLPTIKEKPPIYLNQPPTTPGWKRGERVYNSTPIENGVEGWVCRDATQSPQVWKSFGTINA